MLAFSADPVARWFYPDPHQYLLHLPSFVRAFAGRAFEYNSAYQSMDTQAQRFGSRRKSILTKTR